MYLTPSRDVRSIAKDMAEYAKRKLFGGRVCRADGTNSLD